MESQTTTESPSYWLLFHGDEIMLQKENLTYRLPYGECPPLYKNEQWLEIKTTDDRRWRAFLSDNPIQETGEYVAVRIRESYGLIEESSYKLAGKAYQYAYWDKTTRYCPLCGTKTQKAPYTICKRCPSCGHEQFPSISPASIVLIRKGDSILLVQALNFRSNFHGLVAGFLEPGESLEECVEREVMEETGLKVKNITYFGNQTWPYPSTQMVGFIADYVSGDIKLQEEELSHAAFYTKENLPEIPRKLSLARKMIDWWLEQQGQHGTDINN